MPGGLRFAIVALASGLIGLSVVIGLGVLPQSVWATSVFLALGIATLLIGLRSTVVPSRPALRGQASRPSASLARVVGHWEVLPAAPTIAGWQLHEALGQGGMGVVYRGTRVTDGVAAAVKVLHPAIARTTGLRERLAREADALARVDHPGVVRCLGSGADDGTAWIAMELIAGTDLRRLLADGPVSASETLRIVGEAGEALIAIHAAGIVHRDVKPENILLDGDGRVLVVDFGLAYDARALAMTATGAVLGSLHYMAPEQVRGSAVDHRADQYALAVLTYELLTGELPVGRFPPASASAGVSRRCDAAINRALERSAEARWPDIRAFIAQLQG